MGQKRHVSFKKRPFLGLQHNSRNSGGILAFRAPKGQIGQKRPFPFKNGLFLVYSTIAEIRAKFDHFGPQKRRWARNGPFPSKNGFLGLQHDSTHSGLLITSFQAQTRSLFKIGSIQPGHHLKKRKASSHSQTQTGISSQASRPRPDRCSRLEASHQGTI